MCNKKTVKKVFVFDDVFSEFKLTIGKFIKKFFSSLIFDERQGSANGGIYR